MNQVRVKAKLGEVDQSHAVDQLFLIKEHVWQLVTIRKD